MLMKVSLTRNVKTPSRAHSTDAGIDFYVPQISVDFKADLLKNPANANVKSSVKDGNEVLIIPPGENACIPSGVKVEIPYGFMGMFANKSGFCSKKDGIVGGGIIDTFYSGEVHLDIHNIGNNDLEIMEGDKVAQLIMVPILNCDVTEVEEDMLYDWMKQDEVRGTKGFGSSDRK
jgi:dUTP pyrophosphatase